MISFLHCGDLHLGIFPEHNNTRFNDFFKVFEDVVDYAISNSVKLILIAGDMFHIKTINSLILMNTLAILKKAQANKITIAVIEGNHDRAFYVDEVSWLRFLDKEGYIKLLEMDFLKTPFEPIKVIEEENYRVIGVSYVGGMTSKYLPRILEAIPNDHKVNILMMHAAIERMVDQGMGDISLEEVRKLKARVTYLALGHVHYRYEEEDFAFNPGSLENLRTRDCLSGEKGFYHVRIEEKSKLIDAKYIESNKRPIRFLQLDCSDKETTAKIEEAIQNYEDSNFTCNPDDIIYFTLKGKSLFNPYLIDIDKIKEILIAKYHPLYVEVNNSVGENSKVKEGSESVDINQIITEAITEKIEYQYPEIKDSEKEARQMMLLANKVREKSDENELFTFLSKLKEE